jgi:hypothetical protein
MKLTDHKSAEIHRGYTHMEMDTLKDAIKKLPSLQGRRPYFRRGWHFRRHCDFRAAPGMAVRQNTFL